MMTILNNSKVKVTSSAGIAVFADSSPAPANDPNDRKGWYWAKTQAGSEKFNYFYWTQGSRPLTYGDLRSLFMVVSIDDYQTVSSLPFFVVYTKLQPTGNSGAWYHSKVIHTMNASQQIMLGEKIQMYTHNALPNADYGYRRVPLQHVIVEGTVIPTDEILTISVHSDSASPSTTKMLMSNLGFETRSGIELKIELDGSLS